LAYDALDYCLITGAGIIKEKYIQPDFIVNAHPGLIPMVRGLDSFKWSILNQQPLGVSLHFIDEKVDAGRLFGTEETPAFHSDSLELLARRHYELEIQMMIHFDYYISKNSPGTYPEQKATMRMPRDKEQEMLESYEQWKEKFAYA